MCISLPSYLQLYLQGYLCRKAAVTRFACVRILLCGTTGFGLISRTGLPKREAFSVEYDTVELRGVFMLVTSCSTCPASSNGNAAMIARHGMARPGLARPGMARPSMALPGIARPGLAQLGMARSCMARPGMTWSGMVRPGRLCQDT